MLDTRLAGYWSDEDLYQGAMEAADIAFRLDGTGWAYWSRDGGGFFILRFSWQTTNGQCLTLSLHQELSGTWELEGCSTCPFTGSDRHGAGWRRRQRGRRSRCVVSRAGG